MESFVVASTDHDKADGTYKPFFKKTCTILTPTVTAVFVVWQ